MIIIELFCASHGLATSNKRYWKRIKTYPEPSQNSRKNVLLHLFYKKSSTMSMF